MPSCMFIGSDLRSKIRGRNTRQRRARLPTTRSSREPSAFPRCRCAARGGSRPGWGAAPGNSSARWGTGRPPIRSRLPSLRDTARSERRTRVRPERAPPAGMDGSACACVKVPHHLSDGGQIVRRSSRHAGMAVPATPFHREKLRRSNVYSCSVRFTGRGCNPAAPGVSPSPRAPWQVAQ